MIEKLIETIGQVADVAIEFVGFGIVVAFIGGLTVAVVKQVQKGN